MLDEAVQDSDPLWNALLIGTVVNSASPELRSKVNALFDRQGVDLLFITADDVDRAYSCPTSKTMEMTEGRVCR